MSKFTDSFVCTTTYRLHIYLFPYSISRPNQPPNNKPKKQQTKQLPLNRHQMHQITYFALLLSDANQTFLPTLSNLSALHSSLPIPKTPNKLFQTYLNQLIYRLQMLATLFKIYDNHSTSAWIKFIRLHFTTQYNLILLLHATSSCSAPKIF